MNDKALIDNNMPTNTRVWIYQSSRVFTATEATEIKQRLTQFVNAWTAHKLKVAGDGILLYNLFIVLMADETEVGVSGCSIDSTVHFIRSLEKDFNTDFFDRWNMAYLENGEVRTCNRPEFEQLVAQGIINDHTIVFNNMVHTKGEFETKWQLPYQFSWQKNLSPAASSFSGLL